VEDRATQRTRQKTEAVLIVTCFGALLAGLPGGCAANRPFPRCVAARLYAEPPLRYALCPYADDFGTPVEILDVLFHVDGKAVALGWEHIAQTAGPDLYDCPEGDRVEFVPPQGSSRIRVISIVRQGRYIYQVALDFRRGSFRQGRYRWMRSDAKIDLVETLPEQ
jgi:hypothetical protein